MEILGSRTNIIIIIILMYVVYICARLVLRRLRYTNTRDFHGPKKEPRRFLARGVSSDNIACGDAATCSTFVMAVYGRWARRVFTRERVKKTRRWNM